MARPLLSHKRRSESRFNEDFSTPVVLKTGKSVSNKPGEPIHKNFIVEKKKQHWCLRVI